MHITSGLQKRINELINIAAEPSSLYAIFLPFHPWLTIDTVSEVMTWRDCLGSRSLFEKSPKSNHPTYQMAGNGFPELKFDGTNDDLGNNTSGAILDWTKGKPGASSILALSQQNITPPTSRPLLTATTSVGGGRFVVDTTGDLTVKPDDAGGASTATADTTGATSKHILASTFNTSSRQVDIRRNKISRYSGTVGTSISTFSNTSQSICRIARGNGTNYANAAYQAVILYGDKITNAQADRITDALNQFFNNWYY